MSDPIKYIAELHEKIADTNAAFNAAYTLQEHWREKAEHLERTLGDTIERILTVRSRISLINTDIDRPSAQKDWTDLRWACDELKAVATELKDPHE